MLTELQQLELEEELTLMEREKFGDRKKSVHWLDAPENLLLRQALNYAGCGDKLIKPEQERIYKLLEEATTETERAAREYQIEYIEKHLTRAANLAQARLAYFAEIKTLEDWEKENEKCAADKIHWFKYYAWGYDPRARTSLSVVPFELYPRQQELCRKLDEWAFDRRTSAIVEKSRDEGATELFVRWAIHNWRYKNGFSALLSTRKDEEIDTKKKQGTLFERSRFQIRRLPDWMRPAKFNVEKDLLPDKLITNPDNGNAIQGEAPVERMGSGDRVTCALFDEFAFWRFSGYPQYRSMSQTTDSIFMISSVGGRLNQFADIAFDGVTPKFVLDWRDNPFKDKRWYDSLPYGYISPKMSRTTIAQEVDRDYEASQPGKVWQCPEPHVFITESEFLKPFEAHRHKFFNSMGKFKIPDDWRVIETHDYGKSEGHEWGFLIGAQPTENYPLSDTHFIFVCRIIEPTGLLTAEAVAQWRRWEESLGMRDSKSNLIHAPAARYHSHEQKELRKVLLETYGESWVAWDTDYQTGIETVEEWWTPVDLLEKNPFRSQIYGRCKLVFVAPDDEYQLAYHERHSTFFVTTSQTEAGFKGAREEISAYHYPIQELGKAIKDMRPAKEKDNRIDTIRGYAVNWNRKPVPATTEERVHSQAEKQVSQSYLDQIRELAPHRYGVAAVERERAETRARREIEREENQEESWKNIG